METLNITTGITHGGIFHADDVFSAALLKILSPGITFQRIIEVPSGLKNDTIVFDIGFGAFDHHQRNAKLRGNGVKYAAFGLLWEAYGTRLVSKSSAELFDQSFVQPLDLADNGGRNDALSSAVSSFVPAWDASCQDMDAAFLLAVDFAEEILRKQMKNLHAQERAERLVMEAFLQSDGDVVVLPQMAPWEKVLVPTTAKFVVSPSLRGGYEAKAVSKSLGSREAKMLFPAEWAFVSKKQLAKIAPGITFCHTDRFFIAGTTKEEVVSACKAAVIKAR